MSDLIVKDIYGTSELLSDYKDLQRTTEVNGEQSLSFLLFKTENNKHSYPLVQEESIIEYEGQEYRIKRMDERPLGNMSIKTIQAQHVFFDAIDNYIYNVIDGTNSIFAYLDHALTGSGFTYQVIDAFDNINLGNFGEDNTLSLVQKVINGFGAEVEIDGTVIKFYQQIGNNIDFQFRYKHNLKTINKSVDSSNISTYIKGFGKQNEDGTYVVTAEYTSPNASIYGIRHATPVKDDRYTTVEGLTERLKQEIQDEPEISFTIDFAELKKAGYLYETIGLGDSVYVIWEPLGIDINARVLKYVEYPEEPKSSQVTLANFQNNITDIMADFGTVQKTVNSVVDGSGKVKYSALTEAVKRATEALNNSLTELEYPTNGGIIARDKNNSNRYLIYNSNGLGLTEDGGKTFNYAITHDGMNAELITVGELIGISLTSLVPGSNDKVVLNGGSLNEYGYGAPVDDGGFFDANGANITTTIDPTNFKRTIVPVTASPQFDVEYTFEVTPTKINLSANRKNYSYSSGIQIDTAPVIPEIKAHPDPGANAKGRIAIRDLTVLSFENSADNQTLEFRELDGDILADVNGRSFKVLGNSSTDGIFYTNGAINWSNATYGTGSMHSYYNGDSNKLLFYPKDANGNTASVPAGLSVYYNGVYEDLYHDGIGADKVSSAAYGREATGSGWYSVWMNSSRQFMRNTSSIKYKENVRDWDNAEGILNLRPVIFDRKGEDTPNDEVGFIAEEVQQHIPESIQYFDGEIDGIYDRPLIAGLVSLCQKQQKQIDDLENRLLALEQK